MSLLAVSKTATSFPLMNGMGSTMFFRVKDYKILQSIVCFITVQMVYVFGFIQLAIKTLFHNVAVFVNLLTVTDREQNVTTGIYGLAPSVHGVIHATLIDTYRFIVASLRTIFILRSDWLETYFTGGANFVRQLTPFCIRHFTGSMLPFSSAGVRAKSFSPTLIPITAQLTIFSINLPHNRSITYVYS